METNPDTTSERTGGCGGWFANLGKGFQSSHVQEVQAQVGVYICYVCMDVWMYGLMCVYVCMYVCVFISMSLYKICIYICVHKIYIYLSMSLYKICLMCVVCVYIKYVFTYAYIISL